MNNKEISISQIRNRVGQRSFERGQRYFLNGHIDHASREGDTLRALCSGSQLSPYQVQATLGPSGIQSANCSCPIGAGGFCKHVAALLLTWIHQPGDFTETEALAAQLNRRSKPELVALIQRMVERYPDLETTIRMTPIDGEALAPINRGLVREQIRHVYPDVYNHEWISVEDFAASLQSIVHLTAPYIAQKAYDSAAIIFEEVIAGALRYCSMAPDDAYGLQIVIDHCIGGLSTCLDATIDPDTRIAILRALFDVYSWTINSGGLDTGYEADVIILDQATETERLKIATWVEQSLHGANKWIKDYLQTEYGKFLIELCRDVLDDETLLDIFRRTNLQSSWVDHLLVLGRADEAAEIAGKLKDHDLLKLADVFEAHHHSETIERLIGERALESRNSHLVLWLRQRILDRGDLDEALFLTEGLFWAQPDIGSYQDLRKIAQHAGRWDQLRATVLRKLSEEHRTNLLMDIYLDEERINEALHLLEVWESSLPEHTNVPEAVYDRVGKAAETKRPQAAIVIHMKAVERLVARRGRGNYEEVTQRLKRVRRIYRRLDQLSAWKHLIADLRERHRGLPALQDELNRAGL